MKQNDIKGFSAKEVTKHKQAGKQNIAQSTMTKTIDAIIRQNVFTLFNLMNLLIAVALFWVGAYSNMLFIAIVILNVAIGTARSLRQKGQLKSCRRPRLWCCVTELRPQSM